MRTIRVTGKGQLKLSPDTTRISISLQGLEQDYGEALRRSAEETQALRHLLAGFGFREEDLKTLDFSVDTEYESIQEQGVYRQRLAGYRYRHSMKLDFPSDNDLLGRLLYALSRCELQPEFSLSYTVSDPEKAKNELLALAVRDAAEKARVLSRAAEVELLALQSIDYSKAELSFETRPMNRLMLADCAAPKAARFDLNIQPDDISLSDTVTMVWEIG